LCPSGLGLEFCDVSALQAQNKITGQSRQILFEGLPPQTQDLHDSFGPSGIIVGRDPIHRSRTIQPF
jgi:hypothetical protein